MVRNEFRLTIRLKTGRVMETAMRGRRTFMGRRILEVYFPIAERIVAERWQHAGEDFLAGWYRTAGSTVTFYPGMPRAEFIERMATLTGRSVPDAVSATWEIK